MRRLLTRRITITAVLATAGLLAAACGSSGGNSPGGTGGSGTTLTISDEGGTTWTCRFNPLSSITEPYAFGPVYEPLMFINNLAPNPLATPKAWLATKYAWGHGFKTLTFDLRHGVKFSNGAAFTSADVVYTFGLMKANTAMDLQALWKAHGGPVTSVTAAGPYKVVIKFDKASPLTFYNIADQVPIVPTTFAKGTNPVTYGDANPVGTGAYEMHSCTSNNIEYTANPNYYGGAPAIKKVEYPAFTSNTPANTELEQGTAQWGSQYIPDIKQAYLDQDPTDYHSKSPAVASVSMVINLTNPILKNVDVRQAMAYAINRDDAAVQGEGGEEPPANQADIAPNSTYTTWLDSAQMAKYGGYTQNVKKADQLLAAAGYNKMSGGVRENSAGQKLAFTLINNSGFSDWVNTVQQVLIPELKAVGIQVTQQGEAQNAYTTGLETGKFQLGYYAQTGGAGPFYELRQWLFSGNSAKIGSIAATNFERYNSPATDKLINEFAKLPLSDTAKQHKIVDQLEGVMLKDVPIIPITGEVDWYQYDTKNITGWPTPPNFYAQPAQYQFPDWGQVLMHLKPKM